MQGLSLVARAHVDGANADIAHVGIDRQVDRGRGRVLLSHAALSHLAESTDLGLLSTLIEDGAPSLLEVAKIYFGDH